MRIAIAAAAVSAASCSAPPPPASAASAPAAVLSACHIQDGVALPRLSLRAIGTEPFWGATIDGRCVTYSHPEDQAGTRVWTQFRGSAEQGEWIGFYANRRFVLRTRPQPRCSDGMSDVVYPIAVELVVAGEMRNGCARPHWNSADRSPV